MSFLTIFTAPKPFLDPHIAMIQRNAIRSWLHINENVQVLLIGEEDGLHQVAIDLGVDHLPDVSRNVQGTPLVSSIFAQARKHSSSPLLAYVNADIILLPDFMDTASEVSEQAEKFLVVGQRWDLEVKHEIEFGPDWDMHLSQRLQREGRLHPPGGSDYFIFPRFCFRDMPNFAIGRAGWDNWMFFHARRQAWPVVNATPSLRVIHQDHDYSHLPGGVPHYRLPETAENIRLAGGRRMIFSLLDADSIFEDGMISPVKLRGVKLRREIEIYPLIKLNSRLLAEIFFALFHPIKYFNEWRGRLQWRLQKRVSQN